MCVCVCVCVSTVQYIVLYCTVGIVSLDIPKNKEQLNALKGNTKIIATTIQKFLYIADIAKGLKDKTFAVIIDEAHSSTSGKDMIAVTKTLGMDNSSDYTPEEIIAEEPIIEETFEPEEPKNATPLSLF